MQVKAVRIAVAQVQKECQDFKKSRAMVSSRYDMLVLLRTDNITEQDIQRLHQCLKWADSPQQFCSVHELVKRNRIVSRPEVLLKETRNDMLRPFRFLINKN